jgi:hypothetical protein
MHGKVLSYMRAFQPYRGKPAVRNDGEGRGNVGIIRSPVRASTLPDCGGRSANERPYRDRQAKLVRSRRWKSGPSKEYRPLGSCGVWD